MPLVQVRNLDLERATLATGRRADSLAARVAPPLTLGVQGNGDDSRHVSYNQSNLLRFPSMLGLPGCSLPCGMHPEGLPIGMQLIGKPFAEATLLRIAAAFQQRTGFHTRVPPLVTPS